MTETSETKVTALTVARLAPWPNGDRLLAFFDIEIRGFHLHDCLLIRTSRGFLLAQTPKVENKRGSARAVEVVDKILRVQMAEAAHRAFIALGGAEAA